MPVKKMPPEMKQEIFGNGFAVFGMKPPKPSEKKSERDVETEEDGIWAEALRRLKVRRLLQ